MTPLLRPVPLAELRTLPVGKVWEVDQPIAGLESLTPVRGHVLAVHHGTALEVSGEAETIVTLCCARCLQHYNQGLRAEVRELIEFRGGPTHGGSGAADGLEGTLGDDLDDRLDPYGSFDPERWVFEQLSLQLPLVNRCGKECPGPASWGGGASTADPRWEALKALSQPPA
ncbi:MAG: YceD family protein [Cyanobium sp.]